MTNEFKENVKSYTVRILDDLCQMEYEIDIIRMNQEFSFINAHVNNCYAYLEKIRENLIRLENLQKEKGGPELPSPPQSTAQDDVQL